MQKYIILLLILFSFSVKSQVWMPDNGDGTYKNPILYADYSDPDVIRVNDDYYMVASSFNCQPGIPVLHSKDLVNWTIINYVYDSLPLQRYERLQAGQGSWAPSIRFHKGVFYVFFCTPEDGLFLATTKDPKAKWELTFVQQVTNWEDPCPFWDEDGQAYLIHGVVGAGPAILHKMSPDGKKLLDDGTIIYQDLIKQPVLEGFKFMDKRDGYYYFAAPAGGVEEGWQSIFKSKNIYGPYEDKIVLSQGNTSINGPHQGGLVETQTGEWWFIHFQSKGAYGRIAHLLPAIWKNGWPVIGEDQDGDGTGQPVLSFKKPNVGKIYPKAGPQTSDDFSSDRLGLQWQWQAAPEKTWYDLKTNKGYLRLKAVSNITDRGSLFYAPNILLQKFSAPSFTAITKLQFKPEKNGECAGLTIAGNSYTFLCVEKGATGNNLTLFEAVKLRSRTVYPTRAVSIPINTDTIWLKVIVDEKLNHQYYYSLDGEKYNSIGQSYVTQPGTWIGAKVGVAYISPSLLPSKGYADFNFFEVK